MKSLSLSHSLTHTHIHTFCMGWTSNEVWVEVPVFFVYNSLHHFQLTLSHKTHTHTHSNSHMAKLSFFSKCFTWNNFFFIVLTNFGKGWLISSVKRSVLRPQPFLFNWHHLRKTYMWSFYWLSGIRKFVMQNLSKF